ncbi:MAG: PEGA domain-containing protein [bacterium]|nr:PEGA domain-containing protein [bacterium]
MTLKARRILYISFMIVFFLAAPPLVLYTAGFRYDFQYNRVVETGSLVVKSQPSGSSVHLNGEQYKNSTPTIINTILPGKIKLLVEKDGYHPWEKVLEIKARVTAFQENITLFAISVPVTAALHPVRAYHWNQNQDKLAYVTTDNTLRVLNTLNNKDTLIANLNTKADIELAWSPYGDEFFFGRITPGGSKEYVIVNAQSLDRVIPLSSVTSGAVRSVQWDPKNRASLYAVRSASGELVRLNYLTATERVVFQGPVAAYHADTNRIALIAESRAPELQLLWINPSDQSTVHLLSHADAQEGHEFAATHSRNIALYHPARRELTIIDPSVRPEVSENADNATVIAGVREYVFTEDGSTLVYSDGFGIYTRQFTTPINVLPRIQNASVLVTRYSKPVSSLAASLGTGHVFYGVDGELRASEVSAPSDPWSTTLLPEAAGISDLAYLRRLNALMYIGADNTLLALPLSLENSGAFPFGN